MRIFLLILMSLASLAQADLNPEIPIVAVKISQEDLTKTVNLLAESGLLGGTHFDHATDFGVHYHEANSVETLPQSGKLSLCFRDGRVTGFGAFEISGAALTNLSHLHVEVRPFLQNSPDGNGYSLIVADPEITFLEFADTLGDVEGFVRWIIEFFLDDFVLLENVQISSVELSENYGDPVLEVLEDGIQLAFVRDVNSTNSHEFFVPAHIGYTDLGIPQIVCDDPTQAEYALQQLVDGLSWTTISDFVGFPDPQLMITNQIYRFACLDELGIPRFSLPQTSSYCSIGGTYHITESSELVELAYVAGEMAIYLDSDIELDESVNFSSRADVDIYGPGIIRMSPNASLTAHRGSQVRLHDLTFESIESGSGTALNGSFTEVISCSFSDFNCIHGGISNHIVSYSDVTVDGSNFVFALSALKLLVNQCQMEFNRAFINSSSTALVRVQGSEITYNPAECGQYPIAYDFQMDEADIEIWGCQFHNGGKWRFHFAWESSIEISNTGFLSSGIENACDLEFEFISYGYGYTGDIRSLDFSDVVMEDLEQLDFSSFEVGDLNLNQVRAFGGGNSSSALVMPNGGDDYDVSSNVTNSLFSSMSVYTRETSTGSEFQDNFIACTFFASPDSDYQFHFNPAAAMWLEDVIFAIDCGIFHNETVDYAFSSCSFTSEDWAENWSGVGNIYVQDPLFVDPESNDFRLRWDSPCLDVVEDIDPATYEYDFDLTKRDIGWAPKKIVYSIGDGGSRTTLEYADYLVSGNASISVNAIPAGACIKVTEGATLAITGEASLHIGDINGPRTSIVGAGHDINNVAMPCESISIEGPSNSSIPANLYGVLFNYTPVNAESGEPWFVFKNLDLDLAFAPEGNLSSDASNLFKNFQGAEIIFDNCKGMFSGVTFDSDPDDNEPDFLAVYSSALTVQDCTVETNLDFQRSGRVTVKGTAANGEVTTLSNCDFLGNDQGIDSYLNVDKAAVRIEDSQFTDYQLPAINERNSSIYMDHGASNSFALSGFENTNPIIDFNGLLELYCGLNTFVHEYVGQQETTFFSYPEQLYPVYVYDWRANRWSNQSCNDGGAPFTDSEVVEGLTGVHWSVVPMVLEDCISSPFNCEFWLTEPGNLLSEGKDAESSDHPSVANTYYYDVCMLHPQAKEVAEASNRLKVVGQKGDFAVLYYTEVRDELFAAAALSETFSNHQQAVLQESNGWLVEGYSGDWNEANTELNGMLSGETDPICRSLIADAILELDTYKKSGGLLAMDPVVRLQQNVIRNQNLRSLLFNGSGITQGDEADFSLPSAFAIAKCYPNPFNPVLSIELVLPMEEHVRVRAFNLLGQEVAELMNDTAEPGTHILQFDGSNLGSGLYIIQADSESGKIATQKVMLLK